ncbi:2-polyprenyl-3-methyl-6-methoxy-1,4-benzoquinone monooxygenase [Legionella worsleiensis]|uniref:3-demethoxyubiquinol 3-hydroxylase n=1 Tax=Legionella worsleiensis TaxID=45076 RepID=A0A0W1AE93_9GAMM|nr:2-polyprenyl-3-methyl-6-methoxy-1,4-benzoquinone monooxygenase [Legionella worsleiensis]KTD79661.1 ubiquinone biosynthesis protein [Legionella worsleiensis]STY32171.1 ubiquinone biosynthesis protein [Legionella worsleiensis]
MRTSHFLDHFITEVDTALRTLLPPPKRVSSRPSPAAWIKEADISSQDIKHITGLMRVNHSGEVCAQALYQGQALTAQLSHVKEQMAQAAIEETDHLAWCEERLSELGSKPSVLNPLWYCGSMLLGALAGIAGDKISLGFVVETEKQVSAHLQQHIQRLPRQDEKSRLILEQMQHDEEHHAAVAKEAGATELPYPVKQLMSIVSKLMTKSSYYI